MFCYTEGYILLCGVYFTNVYMDTYFPYTLKRRLRIPLNKHPFKNSCKGVSFYLLTPTLLRIPLPFDILQRGVKITIFLLFPFYQECIKTEEASF